MWWLAAVLIGITLATSAVAVAKLVTNRRAVARCREWTPITGHVVSTSLREVMIASVGTQYIPTVRYRYVVASTQYESAALTIGVEVQYSRRSSAERRLAPYRPGRPVAVLVDPLDPASSVLECRAPIIPVIWMVLVASWVVLIIGLGLMLTPGIDGPEPILRLGLAPIDQAPTAALNRPALRNHPAA